MSKKDERAYTFESLNRDRSKAQKIPFDLHKDRIIILSDVHKGDRSGSSDDFQRNEVIYCCALDYYLKNDFKLILAGDIEEGWECKYDDILSSYKDTAFEMGKSFVEKEKATGMPYYIRIWGNHDKDWSDPKKVEKHLWPVLGKISVYPAVFLGEKIFIVHGHQGDLHSDKGAKRSRFFVKHFWKLAQDILGFGNTRAAKNNRIRRERDQHLFQWAKENHLLLIAGHTHRGMFESYSKIGRFDKKKEKLEEKLGQTSDVAEKLLLKRAIQETEKIIKESKEETKEDKKTSRLGDSPPPCYFNDGCCVHPDGITGIEIDRKTIRLVKWELSDTTCGEEGDGKLRAEDIVSAERKIYQSGNLEEILRRV